jgi:hypothetical protein
MRACSVLERSNRFFRREAATTRPADADRTGVAPVEWSPVEMPNGQAVADEAFAWLNRQLSWQSTLADLERRRARTS